MRRLLLATAALLPVAAYAADPTPPPAPTCPAGMVCVPATFVQQAVIQLGLRDQIGGALAQYLQQAEAQHRADSAQQPTPAVK
jgi:hypothetical protein